MRWPAVGGLKKKKATRRLSRTFSREGDSPPRVGVSLPGAISALGLPAEESFFMQHYIRMHAPTRPRPLSLFLSFIPAHFHCYVCRDNQFPSVTSR